MSPFSPGSRVSVLIIIIILLPSVLSSLSTCHTYQFLTSVSLPVLEEKDMVLLLYLVFCSPLSFIAHQPPYSARVDSSCSILGPLTPSSSSSVGGMSAFSPGPCFAVGILRCLSCWWFLPLLLLPSLRLLFLSCSLLGRHSVSLRGRHGANLGDVTLLLVLLPDLLPDVLHLLLFYFDRLLTLVPLSVLQEEDIVLLLYRVSAFLCRSSRINPLTQCESTLAVRF